MARGQFREDLYYRLHVFEIRAAAAARAARGHPAAGRGLPRGDRPAGRPPGRGISREARELLLAYSWPGNVRELRNVLERATILCDGGLISRTLPGQG